MKNITIAIDDETHRAARVHAARHGTSVSALVKDYLRRLADDGAPAEAVAGVREMHAPFSFPSTLAAPQSPVAGPPVWTGDGKPRQPGALRAPDDAALDAWPADVLASFTAWDDDDFDALP